MKLRLYKSYNFRDKDPVIDKVRTVFQDENVKRSEVHEKSGVALATMAGWFDGTTRRPQFATLCAVLRAIGHDFKIVKK